MDHFGYRDGALWCEDVPVEAIADDVGTPVYVYSQSTILEHYRRFVSAFSTVAARICYSVKCCQNLAICRILCEAGAGFDVVSGGELYRALAAGARPEDIVFAGVGKTVAEIRHALDAGIGWFNIESEEEMERLQALAVQLDHAPQAALRINPDVDPKTHRYTTTGQRESKFGVDLERARRFFKKYGKGVVKLQGIHLHIGSPVNTIEPYVTAVDRALALIDDLRRDGHEIRLLDIGGGYGAHYLNDEAPSAAEYAAALVPRLRGQHLEIVLEPGRAIMANAGILLTTVQYLKASGDRRFVIVDAGMNDLLRPALYGAYHFAWPTAVSAGFVPTCRGPQDLPGVQLVDIVGPVCESGDFLVKDHRLPPVEGGDRIAVFSCGAYGFVMASQYNSRPRPPEVLVTANAFRLIRRRETVEDLLAPELDVEPHRGTPIRGA